MVNKSGRQRRQLLCSAGFQPACKETAGLLVVELTLLFGVAVYAIKFSLMISLINWK